MLRWRLGLLRLGVLELVGRRWEVYPPRLGASVWELLGLRAMAYPPQAVYGVFWAVMWVDCQVS